MFEIQGLDKLQNELKEFNNFMSEIDGEICTVSFDFEDSVSIDNAITEMEEMVDIKAQKYSSNSTIRDMVSEIKDKLKQQIIDKAN